MGFNKTTEETAKSSTGVLTETTTLNPAAMEEVDDSTSSRASEQSADSTGDSNNGTEEAKLSTGVTEPDDVMTESPLPFSSSVTKPRLERMAEAPSSASFKQHKWFKWSQELDSYRVAPMDDGNDSEDDVARKRRISSPLIQRAGGNEESVVKLNEWRRVLIAAKINAVPPPQIGLNLVTSEGNERSLPAPNLGSIQRIPVLLLRDIFSHFDVCTKFRLQRVSREWEAELDSLRLKQVVQFVDFTEFLREFDRTKNHQGETGKYRDDKSLIRSWLKPDNTLYTRSWLLSARISSICDHYSAAENVAVVIKLDDGFEYDSYNSNLPCNRVCPVAANLFSGTLPFWRTDLIFVDSVMSHMCLDYCSENRNKWGAITLIRTTIHAGSVCQHAIQPLYIARHEAEINEVRLNAVWKELLDTYGQVVDTGALSLLRQCVVRNREKCAIVFEQRLTAIYDGWIARYFEMRDDIRSCDLASVDLSRLYPSTIYTLIKEYHPFWKAGYTELQAIQATYCLQCSSLGL